VKFDFLQGDFASGELSPRAQGHVDSDAYKAGLRLASNCLPTRTGSIASRAGLGFMLDGFDANTAAAANLPVQHIPVLDGPSGDFVIEVSPTGLRLMDKFGVLPLNFGPAGSFLQFTAQDGLFAYADADTRTVYLKSLVASGVRSYYLTRGSGAQNALIASFVRVGFPAGTTNQWILSGRIAGDSITAHIVQSNPANFQDIAIAPDVNGNFSITFHPNIGGADQDFYIQLKTGAGDSATTLWDLNLTKNGAITAKDTTAAIVPPTFGGVRSAPTQERVRHASFWAKDDFWVALAGGPGNAYAGYALRGHKDPTTSDILWTFGTLPCTANSLAQIQGANSVAAFQDRLWYGINLSNGKRVIRASVIGYGHAWGYLAQGGSTGSPSQNFSVVPPGTGEWLFQFIVEKETTVSGAGHVFTFAFPSLTPKVDLIVTVNDNVRQETVDNTAVGHTLDYMAYPDGASSLTDQDKIVGGTITFNLGGAGNAPGDIITIKHVAQATDPLDLAVASPTGKIAWLNVLRGLIVGTTKNEKRFSQGTALTVDPATGKAFDLDDESSHGGDPALPALDINDRILFAQRGRKVLRLAGISITSDGGLVSEDVGVLGEHLTAARVRSMCFLKSPVPRAVLAFDDGTGAVMTLVGKALGFSRFTIPACYGGIYNVAALEGDGDSELWVGTENGTTLWAQTLESDIVVKRIQLPNAVPLAPTHVTYDTENPLPPVMDGWSRRPLVNQGGAQYVAGLSTALVGQNAYALINGQVFGPYAVTAGGKVTFPASLALDKVWTDAAAARRAQEIYVGVAYPEHRWTSLPLEGGNPVGTSQNLTSRKAQLYLRFVDSYLPFVNGKRLSDRGAVDPTDFLGGRVSGDRKSTEEGFQRGAVVDVVMDLPLRMEVAAIFGGAVMNNI
jgi:hypothetical protein